MKPKWALGCQNRGCPLPLTFKDRTKAGAQSHWNRYVVQVNRRIKLQGLAPTLQALKKVVCGAKPPTNTG